MFSIYFKFQRALTHGFSVAGAGSAVSLSLQWLCPSFPPDIAAPGLSSSCCSWELKHFSAGTVLPFHLCREDPSTSPVCFSNTNVYFIFVLSKIQNCYKYLIFFFFLLWSLTSGPVTAHQWICEMKQMTFLYRALAAVEIRWWNGTVKNLVLSDDLHPRISEYSKPVLLT